MKKLIENFSYNKNTGEIKRLTRKNSNGSYDKDGYLIIKFKGKQYKAHRLAWLLFYGKFPNDVIDHINGIRDDNRIDNLRDVKQDINCKSAKYKPNKITGVVGVYIDKTRGLKKKYATKKNKKTYRFYSIIEALNFKSTTI